MRILDIKHRPVAISRYAPDVGAAPELDTTNVAVVTDRYSGGKPIIGSALSINT
jgi:hypothetical protein